MVAYTGNKSYSVLSFPGREVLVFDQPEQLLNYLIQRWRTIAGEAVAKRGFCSVALSGGSTPVRFYRKLSQAEGLPWDRTHIFIVDERFVPFDHRDSNYCMINETLLSNITIPHQNIHPVVTTEKNARDSAASYEKKMMTFFHLTEGDVPVFDLILLGIGEDGHTASLFPSSDVLKERTSLAVSTVPSGGHSHDRVTLTLPVINNTSNILFMVTGSSKSEAITEILGNTSTTMPAALVQPSHGRLYFLLDNDAASLLKGNQ